MPRTTRSSTSAPNTPVKPKTKLSSKDQVAPPSADLSLNPSPPGTPKSISVRGQKRFGVQEPKSDSPSKTSRSAKKRRVSERVVQNGVEEEIAVGAEAEVEDEAETVVEV